MFFDIYINERTKKFVVIKEDFKKEENLEKLGYYLISANARSELRAKRMMYELHKDYVELKLKVIPVSIKEAQEFIDKNHRHHKKPVGHKFSIAVTDGESLVGVGVAGRPVSRFNARENTLEVYRLCVLEGFNNACSMLYSRITQIAKSMGYDKVITYLLESETGTSLKASGWQYESKSKGGSWNCKSRKRIDKAPICPKQRWSRVIN